MTIQMIDGFAVNSAAPIDTRGIAADITARDAIPASLRHEGLSVYVVTEHTSYQLQNGITNTDWVTAPDGSLANLTDADGDTEVSVEQPLGTDSDEVVVTCVGGIVGTFSAAGLNLVGALEIGNTTAAGIAMITRGTSRYLHDFKYAGTLGENIFLGKDAGNYTVGAGFGSTDEGSYNIGVGDKTLASLELGNYNIAIGSQAGESVTSGGHNCLIGALVGNKITTGKLNVGIGGLAMDGLIAGDQNVVIGSSAGYAGELDDCVAIGYSSMSDGDGNLRCVAIGSESAKANIAGADLVAIGYRAGLKVVGGSDDTDSDSSIFIGTDTSAAAASQTNQIVIGHAADGLGSNTVVLGNDSILTTYLKGDVNVVKNIALAPTTTADIGVISKDAKNFIHDFKYAGTSGQNIFVGEEAGNFTLGAGFGSADEGSYNIGVGQQALNGITLGLYNVIVGPLAAQNLTIGGYNIGIGSVFQALTEGNQNIGIGHRALYATVLASNNIAIGAYSLYGAITGDKNIAIGIEAGYTGELTDCAALGYQAMMEASGAERCVAVGGQALHKNATGDDLVALGYRAGQLLLGGADDTDSASSIFIGVDTRAGAASQTNQVVIGHNAVGKGSNTVTLGNDSVVNTHLKGQIDIADNISLEDTSDAQTPPIGIIFKNGSRFLHNYSTVGTTGKNTFVGEDAGNLTMGAGFTNVNQASYNIGMGRSTLAALKLGRNNTAVGYYSLTSLEDGDYNIGMGQCLGNMTNGSNNIAIGHNAIGSPVNVDDNVAIGSEALNAVTGSCNVAIGSSAAKTGPVSNCVAIGYQALMANNGADRTVAIGTRALENSGMDDNVAIGYEAGKLLSVGADDTTTESSIFLGNGTRANGATESNQIIIGHNTFGKGSNTVTLGNDSILETHLKGSVNINNIIQTADQSAASGDDLDIQGGDCTSGNVAHHGGNASLLAGDSTTGDAAGGTAKVTGGDADTGVPGNVDISAGADTAGLKGDVDLDGAKISAIGKFLTTASVGRKVTAVVATRTIGDWSGVTPDTDHILLVSSASGAVDVNLPVAANNSGRVIVIKVIHTLAGANAVTVKPPGAETLDAHTNGAPYSTTTQWDTITAVSDGANWFII